MPKTLPTKVIRDLPGVLELEPRLAEVTRPENAAAPERGAVFAEADRLYETFFGFTYSAFDNYAYERNLEYYWAISRLDEMEDEEIVAFFAAGGWDITDGHGKALEFALRYMTTLHALMDEMVPDELPPPRPEPPM
jgi:hypothetical protein